MSTCVFSLRLGASLVLALLVATLAAVPVITQQPASTVAVVGDSVTLSVGASGAPLTYRWLKDAAYLEGETGASLTLPAVAWGDTGVYSVMVAERNMSVQSVSAVVTILDAAATTTADDFGDGVIGGQWINQGTVPAMIDPTSFAETEGRLNFVAEAPGDASERYLINGTALSLNHPWVVMATLGLAENQEFGGGGVGELRCKAGMVLGVGNPVDTADSFDCGVQVKREDGVDVREVFSDHDLDGGRRDYGVNLDYATTAVVVRLSFDPSTQLLASEYLVGGRFVPVATINPLQAWGLTANDQVRVGLRGFAKRVDVPAGLVWADDFRLVERGGPVVATAPAAQIGVRGGSATFAVQANGSGPLSYQWYRDARAVPGANGATLTIGSLQPADVGRYHVAVTDAHGTTATPAVALSHGDAAPSVAAAPASIAVTSGEPAAFSVTASGTSVQYQWRRDGDPIPGATTSTFTIPAATLADAGFYDVEVSSGLAGVVSSAAQLEVGPAQLGDTYRLDTSFVAPRFESAGGTVAALVRAADGLVYAAGNFSRIGDQPRTNLARFTEDLRLDEAYAPQIDGTINALLLQDDGKLVIQGSFTEVNGVARVGVARLNGDGSLDTGFELAPNLGGSVAAMALTRSGRVLLGGWFTLPNGDYVKVLRLNGDGSIDSAFAAVTAFGNIGALAVDDADRIILVESWFGMWSQTPRCVRLMPDGTFDPSFVFSADLGTGGTFSSVLPQGDRIVCGGYFYSAADPRVRRGLFRLNADGSLDDSFSGDLGAISGWGLAIAPLSDGRLVTRSYSYGATGSNFHVLSADGVVDPSYIVALKPGQFLNTNCVVADGGGGVLVGGVLSPLASGGTLVHCDAGGAIAAASTDWRSPTTSFGEVVPAAGGKWYVTGSFAFAEDLPRAGLARLNADGSLDPRFAPVTSPGWAVGRIAGVADGVWATIQSGSDLRLVRYASDGAVLAEGVLGRPGSVAALELAPGGRPVVAAYPATGSALAGFAQRKMARFEADGSVDFGFDIVRGPNSPVLGVVCEPDGGLLLAGEFTAIDGVARGGAARLFGDGSMDPLYAPLFNNGHANGVVRFQDGSAVFQGSFYDGSGVSRTLVRLNRDGVVDENFQDASISINNLVALPDGRMLVGTGSGDSQGSARVVSRLAADGALDELFKVFDVSGYSARVAAITDEGRILVANASGSRDGVARIGLMALKPDVSPVPAITDQPVSQTVVAGQDVHLSVIASGEDLTYQWFKDGETIDGATGATLTIRGIGIADLGAYRVVVSGSWGEAASEEAVLTGSDLPATITLSPGVVVANYGTSATFTVEASGEGPLAYQWRKLGCPITGAISSTYTIPAVEMADAGFYDVVVYNGLSPTVSAAGRLIVKPALAADTYRLDASFDPLIERNGGSVFALEAGPDGETYVGGDFSMMGGVPQAFLARLTDQLTVDSTFRPVVDGVVHAIGVQADGRVLVGGEFTRVNGVSRNRIARLNADGSLDLSFNPGNGFDDEVRAMMIQPDGWILVGGSFSSLDGANGTSRIVRLASDGRRDTSFVAPSSLNGGVRAIALQTDGRIVVGGWFSRGLARLNTDGTIDATLAIGGGFDSEVASIALQPDGGMVVGGHFTTLDGVAAGRIVRLTASGARDPNFDVGSGFDFSVSDVKLLPDGRVAVAGAFAYFDGGTYCYGHAVLTATGGVDPTWLPDSSLTATSQSLMVQSDGRLVVGGAFTWFGAETCSGILEIAAGGAEVRCLAGDFRTYGGVTCAEPLGDGKWLVAGDFNHVNGVARPYLARLDASGALDPSFSVASEVQSLVYEIGVQGDGRVLVSTWNSDRGHFLRLQADGALDPSFSVGTGFDQPPSQIVVLPDGKVATAGSFTTFAGAPCGGIMVLERGGAASAMFATGSGFDNSVFSLAAQADGALLAGGYFGTYNGNTASYFARLLPSGALDTGAGQANSNGSAANAIVVQADGRIVIGGWFNSVYNEYRPYLACLGTDLALDPSFASGTGDRLSSGVNALVDLGDGRFVASSESFRAGNSSRQFINRIDANGNRDGGFGAFDLERSPSVIKLASADRLLLQNTNASRGLHVQRGLVMLKPDVSPAAAITGQPVSQSVVAGQPVVLSVTASGDDLAYQWYKDGFEIEGATEATFSIPAVSGLDLGAYTVAVGNRWGTVISAAADLSGQGTAATITRQPGNVVATGGASATLSVEATGGGGLAYQWRRFGVPIVGANGSAFTIPAVGSADAGFYDVIVYNGLGRVLSEAAQLFVQPAVTADVYRLDTSFQPEFEIDAGAVRAVAVAPNGDVYAGGNFSRIAGERRQRLARFSAGLVLDGTFAPEFNGDVEAIVLQPDGRVVVAGRFTSVNREPHGYIVRLDPDGSVDPTFGSGNGFNNGVSTMVAAPNGDLIVGGWFGWYGDQNTNGMVVRLDSGGSLVASYQASEWPQTVALQSDGRVLAGAYSGFVQRFPAAGGAPEASFLPPALGSGLCSIAVQADDRILVGGGFASTGGTPMSRLVRLTADGALDPSFVNDGSAFDQSSFTVNKIVPLPDSRLVVGGYFHSSGGSFVPYMMVLNANGTRDPSFAPAAGPGSEVLTLTRTPSGGVLAGGSFSHIMNGSPASGLAALGLDGSLHAVSAGGFRQLGSISRAVPADGGKWLVGGYFTRVNGQERRCVVRLNGDGSVDPSFDSGALFYNRVTALAQQGDGKVLVGSYQFEKGHFVRLDRNGGLDPSFTVGSGFDSPPSNIALLPDGRIAATGPFSTFDGVSSGGIVLLQPDGSRDASFVAGSGFNGSPVSLVPQRDGRLVVGGWFSGYNGFPLSRLVRLNLDGSINAPIENIGPLNTVYALGMLPDDGVVVGGLFSWFTPVNRAFRAKLAPDFTVDPSYGTDLWYPVGNIYSMALLPDAQAWINWGLTPPNRTAPQLVGRLLPDGLPDPDLGVFDLSSRTLEAPIVPCADGRILLVDATATRGSLCQAGLVMLKPDVSPMPVVLATTGDQQALIGDSVTLGVTATGEGPLNYIWSREGILLPDVEGPELALAAVELASAGTYSVEVANSHGWASASMVLSVVDAPRIVSQPQDVSIVAGESASVTVIASGSSSPTYQWYRGERGDVSWPVDGASAPTLDLGGPTGWGRYWVRVTTNGISVDSRTALVRVAGGTMILADWTLLPGTPADQRGAGDAPAGDGVCNLLKFALGVAPMESAESRLPRAVIVAGTGADRHLAIEFTRNLGALSLGLELEVSSDLQNWMMVEAELESVEAPVGGLQRVRLREVAPLDSAGRRFARLRVRIVR